MNQPVPEGWEWPKGIGAYNTFMLYYYGNREQGIRPLSQVKTQWEVDPIKGGKIQLHQSRVRVLMRELERRGLDHVDCPVAANTCIAQLDTVAAGAFFNFAYPLLVAYIYGKTEGNGQQNVATLYNDLTKRNGVKKHAPKKRPREDEEE